MSQIAESVRKTDSEFPSINQKDDNASLNNENSLPDEDGNVLPLTHNNKRKKHKKKFRKHSPEYYEQKKVQKFNKKLEEKWDSHFINDHIPDLYAKKKTNKPGKTLSKLTSEKRSITPLNPRVTGNTTANFAVRKDSIPLPKIQKPNQKRIFLYKKGANSFNVHVVPQKPIVLTQKPQRQSEQASQPHKQLKPPTQENKKRERTSQQARRPVDLQKAKQKSYLEEYKKALGDLHEEVKFTNCHKEVLELFFEVIDRKNVRDLLDKEFALIKKKESLVFKVSNAIVNRQKLLQKVRSSGSKLVKDDKEILELIDHYRTSTLAVVEEILKWKETWHALYYEVYKKAKNFDFVYQTQNYLLTLMSSTDGVLQAIAKQRKDTVKLVQKSEKKADIAEQISPKKQQKIEPKPVSNKQIQTKAQNSAVQKQQLALNASTQNAKTSQKQIIVPATNVEASKKSIPEQTPIKQLNSDSKEKSIEKPIEKPIIKTEPQKPTFVITENDPFLISLHSIGKQDKNIILKIRACELLLIEESFNYIKK